MVDMTKLVLSDNQLSSSIPTEWFAGGSFPNLTMLNLGNNR
jgi:hypothetical protein